MPKIYHLEEGSIGKPKQYLGLQIKELHPIDNSQVCCSLSPEKCVKEDNVEAELAKNNRHLPTYKSQYTLFFQVLTTMRCINFCNKAPIIWFSRHQNTVETSTFGSEFIAARIAIELIEAL